MQELINPHLSNKGLPVSEIDFKIIDGILQCDKIIDRITIFSMEGRMICSNEICVSIDLMSIKNKDLYFLYFESDNKKYVKKIFF
jgi:hypothetical protein